MIANICSPVFDQHGITSQQFNVLRILRGAGLGGLPTLDIAEKMIEQAPVMRVFRGFHGFAGGHQATGAFIQMGPQASKVLDELGIGVHTQMY